MQFIKNNWWKILLGLVLLVFVIFAISKMTKGTRIRNQQTNFIGNPTISSTHQGQGNGQGDNKNNQQGQVNQKLGQELSFLPSCPQGKELFTIFPLKDSDYDSITPLGNLNPTGHTFPTDHLYIQVTGLEKYNYLGNSANRRALLAPADIWITKIANSRKCQHIT